MNDQSNPHILHELAGGALRITLNRPDAANAIRAEDRELIISLLDSANQNPEVRAVVLAANGRVFCAGADVAGIANVHSERIAGNGMYRIMSGAQRLVASILDCTKPVIAAVQGAAAGMGAHMAFASDIVVASEDATFIEAFVLRGISVDSGGAYLLVRRMGLQRAKELVFFGEKLSAADAHDLGLVNRTVAPEELAATVDGFVERLVNAPTVAISMSKRLLNRALDCDRNSFFVEEAMSQEITSTSHDAQEGVRAFMERRTPEYKGR